MFEKRSKQGISYFPYLITITSLYLLVFVSLPNAFGSFHSCIGGIKITETRLADNASDAAASGEGTVYIIEVGGNEYIVYKDLGGDSYLVDSTAYNRSSPDIDRDNIVFVSSKEDLSMCQGCGNLWKWWAAENSTVCEGNLATFSYKRSEDLSLCNFFVALERFNNSNPFCNGKNSFEGK